MMLLTLLLVVATLLMMLYLYLQLQVPDNAGPWLDEHSRTPWVEFNGRHFTIHDVRDFRWGPDQRPISKNYVDQVYHLDNLQRAWFGLAYFGPHGVAHALLSFEFCEGQQKRYLVLSIEARRRLGQTFNLWGGFVHQYTKIHVFATEQDAIGLRTHIKGQHTLLYPITRDTQEHEQRGEAFLRAIARDTNALHHQPAFYNTLCDNCFSNLIKHASIWPDLRWRYLRVLLPGHSDRLTYFFHLTPADIEFEEARARATVRPTGTVDAPDFCEQLRTGWHGYRDLSYLP